MVHPDMRVFVAVERVPQPAPVHTGGWYRDERRVKSTKQNADRSCDACQMITLLMWFDRSSTCSFVSLHDAGRGPPV